MRRGIRRPLRRARELLFAAPRGGRPRVGVLLAITAVVVAVAGGLARLDTDTGPESFLPSGDPTLTALNDAARSFGGDPIAVLLSSAQPRQLLKQEQLPKLLALEGRLSKLPDVAVVYGPATVLNQIASTSQNILASLSGSRDLARKAAMQRVQRAGKSESEVAAAGDAAVAAFDRRYGTLVVRGLPAGLPTLRNPRFVDHVIFDQNGLSKPRWRFVVPAPDAVTILVRPREGLDQAGVERLTNAVRSTVDSGGLTVRRTTVTGVPAVTAALGERVRHEAPLLGALAVGLIGACYLLVPWLRRKRARLLPLAVTLAATAMILACFGWLDRPLSLGVIAFLPILLGIASDYPAFLAHPVGRRRVVVAALAGAVAFASLALSPVPFVRDLGLALAAGQILAVGLALLLRAWSGRMIVADRGVPAAQPAWPTGRRLAAAACATLVACPGWVSLAGLGVQSDPARLAEGLTAVEDARYAERVMGASGEVSILVRANSVITPEALDWMRRAQDEIVVRHGSRLRPVVSPPSLLEFLGPKPDQAQILAGVNQMPGYLTAAVFRGDYRRAVMSFQIGLQDLGQQRRLLDEVRAELPPPPPGLSAEVVGLPVAAARGYALVDGNRYLPNLIGIAAAGAVLLVGLRRRSDVLRAVLAAVVATGWGFAAAALIGLELTPLTIALGSLTTSIACEYAVLLGSSAATPRSALRRTVSAAALSATLGYLALAVSGLAVLREFGLVLAGTVVLAFVAAHLVLRVVPVPQRHTGSDVTGAITSREEVMA